MPASAWVSGIVGEVRSVEAVIALRYPSSLSEAYNLHNELATARLSYCVLYADDPRFPTSGWLEGSLTDLADLIRLVSVPHHGVDTAADILQQGIDTASDVLTQLVQTRPDINPAIARRLNMVDVPQMRRIACSIIANAMLFHERLAGRHGIKPLQQIFDTGTPNRQAEVLDAWQEILKINYLDIFQVARGIISELPAQEGTRILNIISLQVLQIAASGVNNDHDLTGQVFQRLIADRKYLATLLHSSRVRGFIGRSRRRQDGRSRLDGPACHCQSPHCRLCLRHGRSVVCGRRADNVSLRTHRWRCCHTPYCFVGTSALRIRCNALCDPYHWFHFSRLTSQRGIRKDQP